VRFAWIALLACVACEAATRNKSTGAALAVGAGVTGAAVYRATTGGCWAQCTHGKVCDRATGTCVDAADRGPALGRKSTTGAADAELRWWEAATPCPPSSTLDRRSFDDDGRVMACKTADGVEEGRATFFHSNGKKQMEGSYCAGIPCHVWTYWDEDGAVDRVEDLGEPNPR
jgi:hypothetical protein